MKKIIKSRIKFYIVLLLIACAGVYLTLYSLSDSIVFFYSPTELLSAKINVNKNKTLKVGGIIKSGSINRVNVKEVSFVITDGKNDFSVYYTGVLPPLFREGQGIVAEGLINNNFFLAKELLTKHDESYKPKSKFVSDLSQK